MHVIDVYSGTSDKGPSEKGTTSHKGHFVMSQKVANPIVMIHFKTGHPLRNGHYGWSQSVLCLEVLLYIIATLRYNSSAHAIVTIIHATIPTFILYDNDSGLVISQHHTRVWCVQCNRHSKAFISSKYHIVKNKKR